MNGLWFLSLAANGDFAAISLDSTWSGTVNAVSSGINSFLGFFLHVWKAFELNCI